MWNWAMDLFVDSEYYSRNGFDVWSFFSRHPSESYPEQNKQKQTDVRQWALFHSVLLFCRNVVVVYIC